MRSTPQWINLPELDFKSKLKTHQITSSLNTLIFICYFSRYRGLKSFRTSPWDKYENLPIEYARIFQFEDIKRTFKKVARESMEGAEPGTFIRIDIKNVPSNFSFGS